jgi:hypothetical protein
VTAFKPAQPAVTPHVSTKVETTPANMSVPAIKKIVSSKMTVGTPSVAPPPHMTPPKPAPAKPVKREYAYQRWRALKHAKKV